MKGFVFGVKPAAVFFTFVVLFPFNLKAGTEEASLGTESIEANTTTADEAIEEVALEEAEVEGTIADLDSRISEVEDKISSLKSREKEYAADLEQLTHLRSQGDLAPERARRIAVLERSLDESLVDLRKDLTGLELELVELRAQVPDDIAPIEAIEIIPDSPEQIQSESVSLIGEIGSIVYENSEVFEKELSSQLSLKDLEEKYDTMKEASEAVVIE